MIHEIELLGIIAKMYLGLSIKRQLSLHCCINVYNINSEVENIVRDSCFVCSIPFDSLSITINDKTHKDWLEQMIKREWISGFPDGYVNKAVKIKCHYDDENIKITNYERVEYIVSEIDFFRLPRWFYTAF